MRKNTTLVFDLFLLSFVLLLNHGIAIANIANENHPSKDVEANDLDADKWLQELNKFIEQHGTDEKQSDTSQYAGIHPENFFPFPFFHPPPSSLPPWFHPPFHGGAHPPLPSGFRPPWLGHAFPPRPAGEPKLPPWLLPWLHHAFPPLPAGGSKPSPGSGHALPPWWHYAFPPHPAGGFKPPSGSGHSLPPWWHHALPSPPAGKGSGDSGPKLPPGLPPWLAYLPPAIREIVLHWLHTFLPPFSPPGTTPSGHKSPPTPPAAGSPKA